MRLHVERPNQADLELGRAAVLGMGSHLTARRTRLMHAESGYPIAVRSRREEAAS